MKQDKGKQRLIEVMQRLDKTFKPQLNESQYTVTDPTKEEMVNFLTQKFHGLVDPAETDANNFDVAAAIYWFANDYHGGQSSNLYSVLSTSDYRPGPMHKSIEDDESETATMMYQELVDKFGGGAQDEPEVDKSQWMGMSMNEKDDKWIQKAVDPEHKGYCTPMTKDTCTPKRKALAKRFKKGIEDEGVEESVEYPAPEEYRSKVEKLKQTIDNLFNQEDYDIIDTLFRLLVKREKNATLAEGADAMSVGHNIYKDVMTLINHAGGEDVWANGAEGALEFYEGVLKGISDALYQDMGDSINKNAGAAPDEMVEAQDKGKEIVYTFNTKALTKDMKWGADKEPTAHNVHIIQGKDLGDDEYNGLVLSIENTPGAWYIDTLLNFHTPNALTYDRLSVSGDWMCVNWSEIAAELKQWLAQNQQ